MKTQTITLTLPESTFRRLQQAAKLTFSSLEDILLSMINKTLGKPAGLPADLTDGLSDELADELAAMALLTDEALWAAAESSLSVAQERRMSQLTQASKERALTPTESAELSHLLELYDQAVLRRAYILALLNQRGYNLPSQSELLELSYDKQQSPIYG